MCGICGIVNRDGSPVGGHEIKSMCDLVAHRGPDAEGHFLKDNFALGHRRLKIIDLSDAANQPFHYEGRYTITYNGEVYNYVEIKDELTKEGYLFTTQSDTEVILAAYDKWGFNCVEKFNGMWSFAIYDEARGIIFCSRDRFGVKPFYYSVVKDKFVFASEIKPLLQFQANRTVNMTILLDYLISGYEDHVSDTFFQNIQRLDPGHNLIYDLTSGEFRTHRHYRLKINSDMKALPFSEALPLFRSALYDAVKLRLRSDVRVGTCLSGGTDSSAVASIAASMYRPEDGIGFSAITAKSSEQETDETPYAKMVVERAGMEWHLLEPGISDFMNNIDEVICSQEEPFGSPSLFMQERVFEKAKTLGCTVMLDGQGGDETLLGYERYYPAYILSLSKTNRFMGFIHSARNSRLSKKNLALYMLYFTKPRVRLLALRYRYKFIRKEYFDLLDRKHLVESALAYTDIDKLQLLEIERLQLPHLLRYEDRNSMKHGVESRLPFLDYRLVEMSLSLNNNHKISGGWTKYILRKATEDILPSAVVWRKNKMGFNAPENIWMAAIENKIADGISASAILKRIANIESLLRNLPTMNLRTKWKLFNIAKWEELYNVAC